MANKKNDFTMVDVKSETRLTNLGVWAAIFSALADLKDTQDDQVRQNL